MSIIKKMKQLGEQIHGAKANTIPVFDKDGNFKDSGRNINNYLPAISNSSRGQFMRVKLDSNVAEWADVSQVPAFTQDDDGKVLTATGSGAAWVNIISDPTVTPIADTEFTSLAKYQIGKLVFISGVIKNVSENQIGAGSPLFTAPPAVSNQIGKVSATNTPVTVTSTGNVIYGGNVAAGSSVGFTITYVAS